MNDNTSRPPNRTVHTKSVGVVRARFVMHPSHQAVADTIDAMNKSPYALRSGASSPGESVTRDQVLTALASQPDGLTATGVCEAIIGRNDARTAHRICAVFVRETKRGFIEPDAGRNAKRKLTERGLEVARELERTAPQRAAQARTAARATERERAQLASRTVNGVFDYAHKIHMGALG